LAIQVSSLILTALQRAAAEPDGLALVAGRSAPGLFSASAAGKLAAQRCKDDGLLQVVRTEPKGKTPLEICALTERGLKHLLDQISPRPVLEALLQAIDRCEAKLRDLVSGAAQQHQQLECLRSLAGKILQHLPKSEATMLAWQANGHRKADDIILDCLRAWHGSRQLGDCPLPDLYGRAREASAKLTIGQYHDALRALHERQAVYLHPWTGPLYEMPEPAVALLTGHEIAYYASLRENTTAS